MRENVKKKPLCQNSNESNAYGIVFVIAQSYLSLIVVVDGMQLLKWNPMIDFACLRIGNTDAIFVMQYKNTFG